MLINETDIATLRKYVKMNFTTTAVKSMPDLDTAERRYLIPILTEEVYDALQAEVTKNKITWVKLLQLCRAAAAPLAVWLDLPFMQVSLSDAGIKSTRTDNTEAAHQWEYREIEKALINKGMAALEDLIKHLLKEGGDYGWRNDDTKESFFRTGDEFSRYVFLHQPHYTFQQLKPLVKEVEDHFIKAAIGETFFAELRDKKKILPEDKKAIELIKKAIAQYTVVRAVERLPVRITPSGLMASLNATSDQANPEKPAAESSLLRLMQSAQREGDSYHVQLKEYLNKTASATVFATYKLSEHYVAPAQQAGEINDVMNGVCAL